MSFMGLNFETIHQGAYIWKLYKAEGLYIGINKSMEWLKIATTNMCIYIREIVRTNSGSDYESKDKKGSPLYYSSHIWPSAVVLGQFIYHSHVKDRMFEGKNVMELSAGTTLLPAILASKCGSKLVIATDLCYDTTHPENYGNNAKFYDQKFSFDKCDNVGEDILYSKTKQGSNINADNSKLNNIYSLTNKEIQIPDYIFKLPKLFHHNNYLNNAIFNVQQNGIDFRVIQSQEKHLILDSCDFFDNPQKNCIYLMSLAWGQSCLELEKLVHPPSYSPEFTEDFEKIKALIAELNFGNTENHQKLLHNFKAEQNTDSIKPLPMLDILMASDLFYDSSDYVAIMYTLKYLATYNEGLQIFITYQRRGNEELDISSESGGSEQLEFYFDSWGFHHSIIDLESFGANRPNLAGSNLPGNHTIDLYHLWLP